MWKTLHIVIEALTEFKEAILRRRLPPLPLALLAIGLVCILAFAYMEKSAYIKRKKR